MTDCNPTPTPLVNVADPAVEFVPPLQPDYVMGMLFASLEVGLEGCPMFEEHDLPDDEGVLAEGVFYHADGGQTRAVKVGGTVYHVTVSVA